MSDERFESWSAFVSHVLSTYAPHASAGTDESVAIGVVVPAGRVVPIVLRSVDVLGRPWFEMTTKLGPAQSIPNGTILARGFNIVGGTPYVEGTTLFLRQRLPSSLAAVGIDEAIRTFAMVADEGSESDRLQDEKGMRGKATPWSDWPSES